MDPLYLEPEDFKKSFDLAPRVAINLFVVNKANQFLLTKRTAPPHAGEWHLPGSFVLKYETVDACIERLAASELGFTVSAKDCYLKLVHDNIDADPRGHVIDIVYRYRVLRDIVLTSWGDSAEMGFFTTIPDGVGFNHAEILKKLV